MACGFKLQGKICLIDAADLVMLGGVKRLRLDGDYMVRMGNKTKPGVGGRRVHTILVTAQRVDHINGDRLDNRRSNLRGCTIKENSRNRKIIGKNNTSGYKGVTWSKSKQRWVAQIKVDRKGKFLGHFDTAPDAAAAYNTAARKYFGHFARVN